MAVSTTFPETAPTTKPGNDWRPLGTKRRNQKNLEKLRHLKLVDKSLINAPPEKIWPYLITPEKFQKWNEKLVSLEARGTFILNQPFVTHYKLSKRETQCLSTTVRIETMRLIEFKHVSTFNSAGHNELEATERVTLYPKGNQTQVIKEVWIRNTGVPWYLAPIILPLIWFVNRFGKRKGEDLLKKLCENE